MIILLLFLFLMMFSTAQVRSRKVPSAELLKQTPPPRIFVNPAQSENTRQFLNGQVKLYKLHEQGTLMVAGKSPTYFLKSQSPHRFETTLLTVQGDGRMAVHASLRDEPKVIVFRAPEEL